MQPRIKGRAILLLISWILLLTAVLSLLSFLEATLNANPDGYTIVSVGWAGYIVSKTFNQQQETVSISAAWTVPQVNTSTGDGYSSVWVGIGGQLDKTLIQVGTEHNVINGKETYSAWYEMLPANAMSIKEVKVSPGDTIGASINLINAESNEWNIQLSNYAKGQLFNQNFVYNSTYSSGEWVTERSTVNGQISNLADFGSVNFTDCKIELTNKQGVIGDFTYSTIHMTNHQYQRLATTSPLTGNGSGFRVDFVAQS